MDIEKELKDLILSKYGTMKKFGKAAGLPETTLVSIFKRGVTNALVGNIMKICFVLNIDMNALMKGEVKDYKHNLK